MDRKKVVFDKITYQIGCFVHFLKTLHRTNDLDFFFRVVLNASPDISSTLIFSNLLDSGGAMHIDFECLFLRLLKLVSLSLFPLTFSLQLKVV